MHLTTIKKQTKFSMCPLRHLKKTITHIDCYFNFVFAAEETGKVGVFLLNENDLEEADEVEYHSIDEFAGDP